LAAQVKPLNTPSLQTLNSTDPEATRPLAVLEPRAGLRAYNWSELWNFRELLYFLVWRDLKVRYKQSALGVLWIVLQPLLTMVIFTIVFNRLLGVPSGSTLPYPVVTYAALLPWTYFSYSVARSSTSLVASTSLVSKIYFPRLFIPLSGILPGLADFGVSFLLLLAMMLYYRITPTIEILFLPLALLLTMLTALGVSLWLSALHVRYRDVQYIVPFLIQVWMYSTPIIYPITVIPLQWRWLYSLNPMVGVVQYFRRVLLGDPSYGGLNWISVGIVLLILASGIFVFRRFERTFADII
jgi:lipopolysaccharide transport system permease protein